MICKKVFISSTTIDLEQYRNEASELITELNDQYQGRCQLIPVFMDNQAHDGRIQPPTQRSTGWVKDCDWFVLIVGWHYGHVPENEEKSVTESEYREAISSDMPTFVFMPGEHYDGQKSYRALPKTRELKNLADWKPIKLLENRKDYSSAISDFENLEKVNFDKLGKFKAELRNNGTEFFTDIDNFLKLLKKVLKNKIELVIKTPEIKTEGLNPQPIDSLYQFRDQISNCQNQINLLAILKRIHDRLHVIRQFGIRRWREEVIMQWNENELPPQAKITYMEGLVEIIGAREGLVSYLHQLQDQEDLKNAINKVIELDLKNCINKEKFQEETSLYASRVQKAFILANKAMLNKANKMEVCQLMSQSKLASHSIIVSGDIEFLKKIENTLNIGHQNLKEMFIKHNDWQDLHDQMERLDSTKGNEAFKNDLLDLIDSPEKVETLLNHALEIAKNRTDKENWNNKILIIRDAFKKLLIDKSEPTYECLRKNFDDLFFLVDRDALIKVEQAAQCGQQNIESVNSRITQVKAQTKELNHSSGE